MAAGLTSIDLGYILGTTFVEGFNECVVCECHKLSVFPGEKTPPDKLR